MGIERGYCSSVTPALLKLSTHRDSQLFQEVGDLIPKTLLDCKLVNGFDMTVLEIHSDGDQSRIPIGWLETEARKDPLPPCLNLKLADALDRSPYCHIYHERETHQCFGKRCSLGLAREGKFRCASF